MSARATQSGDGFLGGSHGPSSAPHSPVKHRVHKREGSNSADHAEGDADCDESGKKKTFTITNTGSNETGMLLSLLL